MTRAKVSIAAAAILLVLALVWAVRPAPLLVETGRVERGPLVIGFEEEGKTRLRERWEVSAPVAGTLQRVAFREGDPVRAGQPVAHLVPATAALIDPANRARLGAEAAAARDALAAAKARAEAADAAAELSRADARRVAELDKRRLVSRSAVEMALASARRDEAALDAAAAESNAALHRLRSIEALLADEGRGGMGMSLPLPSPVDGVVIRRLVEGPAPVMVGTPILDIGDPTQLELEVEVLSTQAVALRVDMPARVLRWGGEGELQARVRRVEPGGFTKISALGVEEQRVRVILDPAGDAEAWRALGDGYRVAVAFITWQADDVLRVPAPALFRLGGAWSLYTVEDGRAQSRSVSIGQRGPDWAEVLSGVGVGDEVVLFPDARLADGVRLVVPADKH